MNLYQSTTSWPTNMIRQKHKQIVKKNLINEKQVDVAQKHTSILFHLSFYLLSGKKGEYLG